MRRSVPCDTDTPQSRRRTHEESRHVEDTARSDEKREDPWGNLDPFGHGGGLEEVEEADAIPQEDRHTLAARPREEGEAGPPHKKVRGHLGKGHEERSRLRRP